MRRALLLALLIVPSSLPAATLGGHVVTPDGAPIGGARVTAVTVPVDWVSTPFPDAVAVKWPEIGATTSSADGSFALDAASWPEGQAFLRVEGDGLATVTFTDWRVAIPGLALPQDLELVASAAVSLEGIVLDDRGAPAPGAPVAVGARSFEGRAWAVTTTRADGTFAFRALPGLSSANLIAEKDGRALARSSAWLPERGTTRVALHLEEDLAASGQVVRVIAGATKPLAGAKIVVSAKAVSGPPFDEGGGSHPAFLLRESTTDAEGRFAIRVPPQATTWLAQPGIGLAQLPSGRALAAAAAPVTGVVVDAAGKPVAGAIVSSEDDGVTRSVTDEQGRFTVARNADRASRLLVRARGLVGQRAFTAPALGGFTRCVLSSRTLAGSVRDADLEDGSPGAPAPRALVIVRQADGLLVLTATDDRGRFAVKGLAGGKAEITAHASEDRVALGSARIGGSAAELVLGASTVMSVRVVEMQGDAARPVGNGWVLARPGKKAELPRRLRADARGAALLTGLASVDWSVGALLDGPRAGAVAAPPGSTGVEVRVFPAGRLRVSVVDASGAPIAHARVILDGMRFMSQPDGPLPDGRRDALVAGWAERMSAATDAQGVAEIGGLKAGSCVQLIATHPGHAPAMPDCVAIPADGRAEVRAILQPAASLDVSVRGPDGRPAAGSIVTIVQDPSRSARPDTSRGGRAQFVPQPVVTDAAGRARLRGLPEGGWIVRAGARGTLPSEKKPITLGPGETAPVELDLAAGARIDGKVVDASGAIAPGAAVRVDVDRAVADSYMQSCWPQAALGEDATFVIDGLLPDSPVTLMASRGSDLSPPKRAMPGQANVTLALVTRGGVAGSVLRDGEPVPAASIRCESGQESGGWAKSAEDGSFEVLGLATGTWTCTAKSDELGQGRRDGINVVAGGTTSATIAIGDPRLVSVTVVDAETSAPLAGVRLRASGGPEQRTDELGQAEVALSPWAADVNLQIEAPGRGWASRAMPPPPQSTMEVRLPKRPSVKGRVVDASGEPATGATVNGGQADAEGRFEVSNVAPGPLRLNAARLEAGEQQAAELLVEVPADGLEGVTIKLETVAVGSLRVHVVEGDMPLADATVRVVADGAGAEATSWGVTGAWYSSNGARTDQANGKTDGSGVFLAEKLVPGGYAILVARRGEGTLGRAGHGTIAGGEVADVTVEPPPSRALSGRVTRGGAPVEAASVMASPANSMGLAVFGGGEVRSNPDGSFSLPAFPEALGRATLVITPPEPRLPDDMPRVERTVDLATDPGEVNVDITGVRITGVVSSGGVPVADAWVELNVPQETGRFMLGGLRLNTRTDGAFTFRGVQPGIEVDLVATHAPLVAAALRVTTPAAGALGPLVLDMPAGEGVTGSVTTSSGPLRGPMWFAFIDERGARLRANSIVADANGSFRVAVPATVGYRFMANTDGFAPIAGAIAAAEPLVLAFTPGGRVDLLVRGPDGELVEGAEAKVTSRDGLAADDYLIGSALGSSWPGAISDATGHARAAFVVPGEYALAIKRGDLKGAVTLSVRDGEVATGEVRLAH